MPGGWDIAVSEIERSRAKIYAVGSRAGSYLDSRSFELSGGHLEYLATPEAIGAGLSRISHRLRVTVAAPGAKVRAQQRTY